MTAWSLARAAGFTAYGAFTLATIAGLMLSSKYLGKKMGRRLTTFHEAMSIAGLLLIVAHVWALLNDSFFDFSLTSLLLPGASPYSPLWVGVGAVSAYLSGVIIGSFYVRKWIGPRTWRRIHYTSPIAFVTMTLHGLLAGSDSGSPIALAVYASASVTTLALFGYRVVTGAMEHGAKKAKLAARARRAPDRKPPDVPANPAPAASPRRLIDQSHPHVAVE
jgi:predicted ferric reductase